MNRFDEIVSLGYNCEISFRIKNFTGKLESWPFSWSYILDRDKFLESFDNLGEIFQGSVSIADTTKLQSMIQCDKYKICFHPRAEFLNADCTFNDEKFADGVIELKSRVKYLINKLERLLQDPQKRTLFIVGITDNGKTSDAVFVKNLYDTLMKKYISGKFVILVIVPKSRYTKELKNLESKQIKIRTIKKFGVQKYNEISTDSFGWVKALSELLGYGGIFRFYKNLSVARVTRVLNAIKKRITR